MVFRVFSGIIGFVFFTFLVLLTFFSGGNSGIKNFEIQDTPHGFFTISGSGALDSVSELSLATGDFSFQQISDTDRIYFKSGSEYTMQGNTIELGKGEFIISIKSLHLAYEVSHSFFEMKSLGFGNLYINTTDDKNYSLFSFDGIFDIGLRDGNDYITGVHLYPHMYLRLNPLRSRFLKNADLVRISSVFTLDSIFEPLSVDNIDGFIAKLGIGDKSFLDRYLGFSVSDIDINADAFSEVAAIGTMEFPGVGYVKKYFYVLFNNEKKKSYYKNALFQNLAEMMKSDDKEPGIISEITTYLDLLSPYPEDRDEMLSIINHYYKLAVLNPSLSNTYAKINLYSLLSAIGDSDVSDDYESKLSLKTLYENFNIYQNYSYESLLSFSRQYIDSAGIFGGELSLDKKEELDYFSLFLSKLFISKFSSADDNLREFSGADNLKSILEVMSDYVKLNTVIYDSLGEKREVTGMYLHLDILQNLDDFIRNGLFQSERGTNGILVKSKKFEINTTELSLLEKNINDLLGFYEENKKFISTENQQEASLINGYDSLSLGFMEYFAALDDYESYIYNYDETKINLFGIETLGEKDGDIVFTKSSAINYLKKFSAGNTSDIKIDLGDDYYDIDNFIIDGKNLSFYLYPFDGNKIDNIVINAQPISVSYKLDTVEWDWSVRIKTISDQDEKNKYTFSNFFQNTFSDTQANTDVEIFEVNRQDYSSDDKFITVFKRDKLLGSQGEFTGIGPFLDIEFADIDVVARDITYDIFISDADLNINGDGGEFSARFASDYVLETDKHYFKNIRLYPYQSNLGVKKPLLGDNFIQIVGNIDLVDLEQEMLVMNQSYANISYIYNSIAKQLDIDEITVRYIKSSKKVNFRFDYGGDFISILLSGDTIENISMAGEVIVRDANYRTINDILTTIKK